MYLFGFKLKSSINKKELLALRRAQLYYTDIGELEYADTIAKIEQTFRMQLNYTQISISADEKLTQHSQLVKKDVKRLLRVYNKLRSHDLHEATKRRFFYLTTKLSSRI